MSKISIYKLKTLIGHKDCVYTLERSDSENIFFSGAGDGMVVSWDMEDAEKGQLIARLPNSVYALHYFEPKGTLIVGHNYDGIHLLDWRNRKETGSLNMTRSAIFDIHSFQNQLIIGDTSGMLTMVNADTLTIKESIKVASKSARSIAINEAREEMAVGFSDNVVRIFDLNNFSVKHELQGHINSVFSVKYSPDKNLLLTAGRDAHLKIWDVNSGYLQINDIVAHMYAINNIEFSPDGKHFVTCSMDKSIKVWDALQFKLLKVIDKARHAGHGTSVNKLLWSDYKETLISASDDHTISLWNIGLSK